MVSSDEARLLLEIEIALIFFLFIISMFVVRLSLPRWPVLLLALFHMTVYLYLFIVFVFAFLAQ